MSLPVIMMAAILAASVLLLADPAIRGHALGAVVASGLDLAHHFDLVRLYLLGIPLQKVIPAGLVIFGLLMLLGVHAKTRKFLAAIVLVLGAILLVTRMGWV